MAYPGYTENGLGNGWKLMQCTLTKPLVANNCWYLCWCIENHKSCNQAMVRLVACFGVVDGAALTISHELQLVENRVPLVLNQF